MNDVGFYLLFDRIRIQAANTVSSPLTYGFPAVAGFLGAIHALSRKLAGAQDIQLDGVLIACHDIVVKRFRPSAYSDYTFNQSRNPVKKNGETAAIVEEGKVDLTVSLLVEVRCDYDALNWLEDNEKVFEEFIRQQLLSQRLAGGSVHHIDQVKLLPATESEDGIRGVLMPGFVLMNANAELMAITERLQEHNPEATALDALVDVATLHHVPVVDDKAQTQWETHSVKTGNGWLVPMPVGFQAIAGKVAAGEMQHCRTTEHPSQYVECLYGLGKWVFPLRLPDIEQCFWRYSSTDQQHYLISQTPV